ncbi:MAG: hypothetical protein Q4F24_06180 [Eubacteriales bacterium]|nr:hypothetical protein [Eubacteriales bacterium]
MNFKQELNSVCKTQTKEQELSEAAKRARNDYLYVKKKIKKEAERKAYTTLENGKKRIKIYEEPFWMNKFECMNIRTWQETKKESFFKYTIYYYASLDCSLKYSDYVSTYQKVLKKTAEEDGVKVEFIVHGYNTDFGIYSYPMYIKRTSFRYYANNFKVGINFVIDF